MQHDVKRWVHEELFRLIFPGGQGNPIDVEEFIGVQQKFALFQPLSVGMSENLLKSRFLGGGVIEKLAEYHDMLVPLVEKYYGAELEAKDCSPSPSCLDQLTAAFLDSLVSAGGLSVPGAITTGLWVLHANTKSYGSTFPNNIKLDNTDPLPFFYESLRFFPPVVGFPWWEKPPPRAFDDDASQYGDGKRKLVNLAGVQRDPNGESSCLL